MDNNEQTSFDATYAPQSPDLSTDYVPEPIHPQHKGYRGSISHTHSSFSPVDRRRPFAPISTQSPFATTQQPGGPFQPPPPPFAPPKREGLGEDNDGRCAAPWKPMPPSTRGKRVKSYKEEDETDYENGASSDAAYGEVPVKADPAGEKAADVHPEIKTKFPVARIKRIMQSDEDVGKVAQVTPVVVSKALELFMIDLVTSAAAEAKSRSSKRVTASHLKQAVMNNNQFKDWLSEIVSKAPDVAPVAPVAPVASGKGHKGEDSEDVEDGAPKKRKGLPRGRKKKVII